MGDLLSTSLSRICLNMNHFSIGAGVSQGIIFSLFFVVGFIPIIQVSCCKDSKKDHSCKEQTIAKIEETKVANCLRNAKDSIVKLVFDKVLEKNTCTCRCTCSNENFYTISSYKAPPSYTAVLFLVLLLLIPTAILQFFDLFFFEQTLGCNVNDLACCYDKEQTISQRLDCSNASYLENNNITSVICYRFALSPGTATGSAAGIISAIALIISIVNTVLLKCSNGKDRTHYRAVCTIIIQIVAFLIALGVTIGMCVYYSIYTHPIKAQFRIAQVYPAGVTLLIYILIFPWWKFEKLDDKRKTDERQSLLNYGTENTYL